MTQSQIQSLRIQLCLYPQISTIRVRFVECLLARDHSLHNVRNRNIVSQCQTHTHSKTCFKYWRGPPEPKTCRFDLHEDNFRAKSCFDPETGEICLRCLDGLVNNFNATIIQAIRCNMDIKFIGSGASAKGILSNLLP
ncbi:hypothetical protein B0H13DRAFT_1625131 [Mycena leptocephala]|nr:hypothetical protein B0H13DRAFT_1625131 [Mycena leptocephala]